jgi:hypothetical protein
LLVPVGGRGATALTASDKTPVGKLRYTTAPCRLSTAVHVFRLYTRWLYSLNTCTAVLRLLGAMYGSLSTDVLSLATRYSGCRTTRVGSFTLQGTETSTVDSDCRRQNGPEVGWVPAPAPISMMGLKWFKIRRALSSGTAQANWSTNSDACCVTRSQSSCLRSCGTEVVSIGMQCSCLHQSVCNCQRRDASCMH